MHVKCIITDQTRPGKAIETIFSSPRELTLPGKVDAQGSRWLGGSEGVAGSEGAGDGAERQP